jgi:peptidoglycan hydrolase CwlO-like protein
MKDVNVDPARVIRLLKNRVADMASEAAILEAAVEQYQEREREMALEAHLLKQELDVIKVERAKAGTANKEAEVAPRPAARSRRNPDGSREKA